MNLPQSLNEVVSNRELLDSLEPEEVGWFILKYLHGNSNARQEANPANFSNNFRDHGPEVLERLMEGFSWLVREGLLIHNFETMSSGGFYRIGPRGRRLVERKEFEVYRRQTMLPRALLHPRIAANVLGSMVRGKYDTAVFESMKEVEIAVRNARELFGERSRHRPHAKGLPRRKRPADEPE